MKPDDVATLAAMVKELAAADPIYAGETDGSSYCIFCHADWPSYDDPLTHDPDCLWCRAVALMGAAGK